MEHGRGGVFTYTLTDQFTSTCLPRPLTSIDQKPGAMAFCWFLSASLLVEAMVPMEISPPNRPRPRTRSEPGRPRRGGAGVLKKHRGSLHLSVAQGSCEDETNAVSRRPSSARFVSRRPGPGTRRGPMAGPCLLSKVPKMLGAGIGPCFPLYVYTTKRHVANFNSYQ